MMVIGISIKNQVWVGVDSKGAALMNEPSKIKHILDVRKLSFDPSMTEIMELYEYFRSKYNCLATEVHLEEMSDRCNLNGNDHCYGCYHCNEGYIGYIAMVFSRKIPNDKFDQEMTAYRAACDDKIRLEENRTKSLMMQKENLEARQAWKNLQRQERVARRKLGRHTMIHTA